MRKQYRIVVGALAVAVGLLAVGRATAGGSLNPTNAPGPTMHTLEEIFNGLTAGTVNVTVNNTVLAGQGVPKTGATTSYQTGDDGTYQKGVAWPSPRFTVQVNTNTVMDNLTGLVWSRNANLGGTMNWSNAIAYCESLTYGGHSDWRLPNIRELQSLIAWQYGNPALCNTAGTGKWSAGDPFTGVQSFYYWSGTSHVADTTTAFLAYFGYGDTSGAGKSSAYYVWPVRGGQ